MRQEGAAITRREVTFGVNYVFGLLLSTVAFLYFHFFAGAPSQLGPSVRPMIAAAVASAVYIRVWGTLVPLINLFESGPPDRDLFIRGVVAFIYSMLSVLMVIVGTRSA